MSSSDGQPDGEPSLTQLERFAAIIRRQERERCAKEIDKLAEQRPFVPSILDCAAAIRAMEN